MHGLFSTACAHGAPARLPPLAGLLVFALVLVVDDGRCIFDRPAFPAASSTEGAPVPRTVALVPPPPSYPRLGEDGFEGLSATESADQAAVQRAFSGALVLLFQPPQLHIVDPGAVAADLYMGRPSIATVNLDGDVATKVNLHTPAIETVHGLRIGDDFAKVLALGGRRRCETVWGGGDPHSPGAPAGFIRCWVGDKPARFRYVTFIESRGLGALGCLGLHESGKTLRRAGRCE